MLTDWNDATGVSLLFKFKGSNKSKKIASRAAVDSLSPDKSIQSVRNPFVAVCAAVTQLACGAR